MPGSSLPKSDIDALRADIAAAKAPKEVLAILAQPELDLLDRLEPDTLHEEDAETILMPLVDIFRAMQKRVLQSVPFPEDYPEVLVPGMDDMEYDKHQNSIGFIVENDGDTEPIEEWIVSRLADMKRLTRKQASSLLLFQSRSYFDGPVSVVFIPKSAIPPEYWEAYNDHSSL
ncbi:MAG: hypothetical protein JWM56_167 [Candidatus Peribacteria bacterium]|nr:hypothetical protein [Candidatus Peribacteria bacterium]